MPNLKISLLYSSSHSESTPLDIMFCQIVCFSEVARCGRFKKTISIKTTTRNPAATGRNKEKVRVLNKGQGETLESECWHILFPAVNWGSEGSCKGHLSPHLWAGNAIQPSVTDHFTRLMEMSPTWVSGLTAQKRNQTSLLLPWPPTRQGQFDDPVSQSLKLVSRTFIPDLSIPLLEAILSWG